MNSNTVDEAACIAVNLVWMQSRLTLCGALTCGGTRSCHVMAAVSAAILVAVRVGNPDCEHVAASFSC